MADNLLSQDLVEGNDLGLSFLFDKQYESVQGKVIISFEERGGKLVLLRNVGYQDKRSALPGWKIIPLWLSESGQSGVLATWKPIPDLPHLKVLLDTFERIEEEQATNCMAL